MAQIVGIEGMSPEQLVHELQGGVRFVQYQFCFSVGIMTIKQGTNFYFGSRRRKPGGKRPSLVVSYSADRMVGDTVGTNLHRPVIVAELSGRG
jgi:hypothetical protein